MSKIKQQSTIKDMILATIEKHIDTQNEKGMKKYGETIDDCPVDAYDWVRMALEEAIDLMQYQQKENGKLSELLKAKDEEIARLQSFLSPPVGNGPNTIIDGIPLSVLAERMKLLVEIENLRNQLKAVGLADSKPEPEQSPKEALDSTVGDYKAVSERDEIIEDLQDENQGLLREIEDLKISRLEWRNNSFNAQDEIAQLRSLLYRSWGVQ